MKNWLLALSELNNALSNVEESRKGGNNCFWDSAGSE